MTEPRCDNKYMVTKHTMTELLRKAVAESKSKRAISIATGLTRQSLIRFGRGETSMRLDLADRLAEHFGITVNPPPKEKAKPTPKKGAK